MADVAVQNPATGELHMVAEADVPSFIEQTGFTIPDQAERERGARIIESGGLGQQALAAGEAAVRTGTFGIVPGVTPGWQQRAQVLHEEHPYVETAARAAGALAPALATGGLGGAAAGAVGLGARGAGYAAAAAEGLAGGLADEIEAARAETRDVSAGNVLLFGLGGELAGRALPAAFKMGAGRVRRALSAAEEVAGEGLPSALAAVEARSVESQAQLARGLPEGAERAAALERTAPQQYEHLATEGAGAVEQFDSGARAMMEPNKRVVERIKQALPDASPAQQNWLTQQKQKLADEYLSVDRRAPAAPVPEGVPAPAAPVVPAAPSAAEEYALDAARRRLRGVADRTKNADYDALVGEVGERSESMKGLPDEVKRAINERTGAAKLEDIVSWVKDPDALRTGHGIEAPASAAPTPAPGAAPAAPAAPAGVDLGAYGKDVRNAVRSGLRRMDQAAGIGDQYFIARDMASQFEEVAARIAKDRKLGPTQRAEMLANVTERAQALRQGLTDESLFGSAAKLESDLSRGTARMRQGLDEVAALSDPAKMRRYLQSDRVDRAALTRKLDDALEGAEDLLATHEAHGTLDPRQLAEQRARIGKIRQARGMADEIQVAKASSAERAAASKAAGAAGAAATEGSALRGIAGTLLDEAVEFAPYPVRKLYQLGKRVKAIDDAARAATKQTARRLAGTAVKAEAPSLARSVGKALKEEAVAAVDRAVPGASKGAKRVREIIERRRASAGMADVGAAAPVSPKIGKLTGKLEERLGKLRELESAQVAGAADDLGFNLAAERHAASLERAQGALEETLHTLRDEYISSISDTLEGGVPEDLRPKARARYDRYKAGLDELDEVLGAHGGRTEQIGGVELYSLGERFPEAAAAYLEKRRGGSGASRAGERGYFELGTSGRRFDPAVTRAKIGELPSASQHDLRGSPYPMDSWVKMKRLLSEDEEFAIQDYKGDLYKEIRAVLRGETPQKALTPRDLQSVKQAAAQIEPALEKLSVGNPTRQGPLYRGIKVSDAGLAELMSDDVLHTATITSSSYNPHEALKFAAPGKFEPGQHGVVFKIDKADRGALMNPDELEVLLPKGGKYQITERSRLDSGQLLVTVRQVGNVTAAQAHDMGALGFVSVPAAAGASLADFAKGLAASPLGVTIGAGTLGLGAYKAYQLGAPKIMGALDRFTGEFSGPEESFAAKKKLLDQDLVSPDTLFEAIGASLEDLPKVNPELYQQLAARVAKSVRYVRENLPAGIKTTMMYPNGTPPSMSALRDFATIWNTTMDPKSVLEDIESGTATGLQMKTLREAHPDIYDQLHKDVVTEIGQNFRTVPLSTKLQMDILFNADGVAGPFFSNKAAGYIALADKEWATRKPKSMTTAPPPLDQMSVHAGPAGLGAIQSSVTNKGAGA